jgi:hypothetical protein
MRGNSISRTATVCISLDASEKVAETAIILPHPYSGAQILPSDHHIYSWTVGSITFSFFISNPTIMAKAPAAMTMAKT